MSSADVPGSGRSLAATVARGRVVALDGAEVAVRTEHGVVGATISGGDAVALGDIVSITEGHACVLTPTHARDPGAWLRRVQDPRRIRGTRARAAVEAAVREFFLSRGFLETRTPVVVDCPGMEPHVRPFPAGNGRFLHTSPELAMKRLLVGGMERIFQICPAFRDEPVSATHRPEFTLLEWYRAYAGYEDIMRDTEELLAHVASSVLGRPSVTFRGREISLAPPWPRLRVRDLFREHAGVDLVRADLAAECRRLGLAADPADTWDDLYFRIWLACVEPRLPPDRPALVTRYPASQAALSVVDTDPDGTRWARRFEIYAGGLELANAFEELTCPVEQRRRFEADMELRARTYGPSFPPTPIDEEFLQALAEGMPPAGGIALGIDRLVMLIADEPDIAYTFWL